MVFNMTAGLSLELQAVSGAFANLTAPQVLKIPLAVRPLLVLLRTGVGSASELAAYYRAGLDGEFELRLGGGCAAACRLQGEYATELLATVTGASPANAASLEYYILGVKK